MRDAASKIAPASIRAEHLHRFDRTWSHRRKWALSALGPVMFGLFVASGLPNERVVAVGGIVVAAGIFQLVARSLFARRMGILGLVTAVLCVTGGLMSPLAPMLTGPSIAIVSAHRRRRETRIALATLAAIVIALAFMPAAWSPPPPRAPYGSLLVAVAILFSAGMLASSTIALSDARERAEDTLDRMREQLVDAASERARSVEMIGAKVAHELKNPLAAVKALVQLLARASHDASTKERIDVIATEVARMEAITQQYLAFSRPMADLREERVDLAVVLDDVFAVLAARAEASRVKLASTRRERGDAIVSADPRRLKEALLNVVANALEATPPGGVVEASAGARDDGLIEVIIRDTGRGMSADTLARVGTPFFTTRSDGTGLGAMIARAIVARHGGTLHYDSTEGRGTTVTLVLPRKRDDGARTPD